MPLFGHTLRHLKGLAQAALLFGCLSLMAFQQFGPGAHLLVRGLIPAAGNCGPALASGAHERPTESFASDSSLLRLEATLTERRPLLVLSTPGRARSPAPAASVFHNNCRPVVLRTRAVFCDFSLLRSVLHPHLRILENAATVLC